MSISTKDFLEQPVTDDMEDDDAIISRLTKSLYGSEDPFGIDVDERTMEVTSEYAGSMVAAADQPFELAQKTLQKAKERYNINMEDIDTEVSGESPNMFVVPAKRKAVLDQETALKYYKKRQEIFNVLDD